MADRQGHDVLVVDAHARQGELGQGEAQLHRGQTGADDQVGHALVVGPHQDPVAAPVLQPGGRRLAQAARLEVERPGRCWRW